MNTLEEVRAAKSELAGLLRNHPGVNGVGIGVTNGHTIRVNLVEGAKHPTLPSTYNGVPVESVIIGKIVAQALLS